MTAAAQAPIERPAQPKTLSQAQRQELESWPAVGFDVTVLDAKDNPVTTATPGQLEVHLDGQPVAAGVELHAAGSEPQSVCLLVDTSGSTYEDRDAIQRSLRKFIHDLPPQDELCLIDFSVKGYVDAELSIDRSGPLKGLQYLKSSGGSAVYDAVDSAAKYLVSRARFASRVILLLSDGDDNASAITSDDMLRTLRQPGAPVVYALEIQSAKHEGDDNRRHARHFLHTVATETGGLVYFARGDADVDATAANLIQALSQRYRLVLTTSLPRDGSPHRLEVVPAKDIRKQKWNVNAPRGFDAPLP